MTEEEFSLSICIPFCDKDAHFIPELLRSIDEKVRIKDYEILLFDNRDNKNINIDFSNSRIKYFDMNGNQLPFKARIEAFLKASKKYIWFIDADDSIEFLEFKDIENISYSSTKILRFLYLYDNKLNFDYRITNILIPKNNQLYVTLLKEKLILNKDRKIYFSDDTIILNALKKHFTFIDIKKTIYFVNTTSDAGMYSRPFRSIQDYELLLEGSEFEFSTWQSSEDTYSAHVFYVTMLREICKHNYNEQKEIFKIMHLKGKISFDKLIKYIEINIEAVGVDKQLLSAAKSAALESEHK